MVVSGDHLEMTRVSNCISSGIVNTVPRIARGEFKKEKKPMVGLSFEQSMPQHLHAKQYIILELLQVMCFAMYSLPEAWQWIRPDLLSLGQYLQFLVLQGLQGPKLVSLGFSPGSLALTKP